MPFFPNWTMRVSSTGTRYSWMRASLRQKKGSGSREDQAEKGSKCLVLDDSPGIPLGIHIDSASTAEIKLLDNELGEIPVPKQPAGRPRTRPRRMIGDKAYDCDPARKRLKRRGINDLVPHRKNHQNIKRQKDRLWDRYKRRYIIERTFRGLRPIEE